MVKVNQSLVDGEKGDCFRAALASLFETDVEETINIIDFVESERGWAIPFMEWVESIGYEYEYFVSPSEDSSLTYSELKNYQSVGGFFIASVESRNYEGGFHAVIIDTNGVVVHDPEPLKKWLGCDVVEGGLVGWYVFEPAES